MVYFRHGRVLTAECAERRVTELVQEITKQPLKPTVRHFNIELTGTVKDQARSSVHYSTQGDHV
jgi:hypothetical protein